VVEEELVPALLDGSAAQDPRLTDRERAALRYTERFWHDHASVDRAAVADLLEHVTEGEFLELATCVSQFIAMGKLFAVLGIPNPAFDDPVE
jgi:alkylhydroperoxidase family enzyme